MGIFSSRIDYKLLDECEKRLSQIDSSLTGFASSIDSVHGVVKLLIQKLEETVPDDPDEGTYEIITLDNHALKLTRDLLSSVENTLYNEKITVLKGISELIHFLKDRADNKTTIIKRMPTLAGLNIDKYIAGFQKKQKMIIQETKRQESTLSNRSGGSSVDPEKTSADLERIIKKLEQANKSLEQTNAMLKTENDERLNENKISKEEIENCLLEKERITAEMNALKDENCELQKDLEKALRRVEIIPVQIYYQRRGSLIGLIEEELLANLNKHLSHDNKELEVIRCATSAEIQPDKPLLVLCISTSRIGTDVKNALQGVFNLRHSALLIFHHKDEHALPSQSSDRVLGGPDFKPLRGIFDLAFLSGKGMYACGMNSQAITDVVEFISKVSGESGLAQNMTGNFDRKTLSR